MVISGQVVTDTVFQQALNEYQEGQYLDALEGFSEAHLNAAREDSFYNKYLSYHGLMLVLLERPRGMEMCRNAAANEQFDGDVFLNLAKAEQYIGNRKGCVQALQNGLLLAPDNIELRQMRAEIGTRRKPLLRFLHRDHPVNVMFGKMTYLRQSPQRPAG